MKFFLTPILTVTLKKNYFLFLLIGFKAFAYVSIDVGKAHVRQSQVALQPLILTNPSLDSNSLQIGSSLFEVLEKNLSFLGRFTLINQEAFLEKPGEKSLRPYPESSNGFIWKNWQLLNTDYLIMGKYSLTKKNLETLVQVECFVYHVPLKKQLLHKKYSGSIRQIRQLAHYISNDFIQVIAKTPSMFLTKITAVKSLSNSKKELFIMDWDGVQQKQISFHRSIVMLPFWSSDGKSIAYTAFLYNKRKKTRNGALLLYNRLKKNRKIISNRKGINLGFGFLPGGKHIIASLFLRRDRNIVKISLLDFSIQPITFFTDGSINVDPAVHPNGKTIVFSSDRGGKVMLYSTNFYGSSIKRLTYQGHYNATPEYSPDGKTIVFSGYDQGRFDLFIMNADGTHIRRLTSRKKSDGKWANNESPSFSPDGRYIVFSSNQTGKYQLYIIDLQNYQIQQITNDQYGYKSPKWSPFLTP